MPLKPHAERYPHGDTPNGIWEQHYTPPQSRCPANRDESLDNVTMAAHSAEVRDTMEFEERVHYEHYLSAGYIEEHAIELARLAVEADDALGNYRAHQGDSILGMHYKQEAEVATQRLDDAEEEYDV